MTLDEYLKSPGAMTVGQLREAIGVKSDMQIRQWRYGYGNRQPDPANCVAIERATGGAVSRRKLRPNDWWLIWPELICEQFPVPAQKSRAKRVQAEAQPA